MLKLPANSGNVSKRRIRDCSGHVRGRAPHAVRRALNSVLIRIENNFCVAEWRYLELGRI